MRPLEEALADGLAQLQRLLDPGELLRCRRQAVHLAEEAGQVRRGSRAPRPGRRPAACAFFMSTRLWKNVVIGRQRIAGRDAARAAPSATGSRARPAGPEPVRRRYQSRSRPNFVTPSLSWLSRTKRGPRPAARAEGGELGVVVDDGDGVAGRRRAGRRG